MSCSVSFRWRIETSAHSISHSQGATLIWFSVELRRGVTVGSPAFEKHFSKPANQRTHGNESDV